MRDTDTYESPTRVPAGIALLLTVLGAAGMIAGFVFGVEAAFRGTGTADAWFVVFFAAAAFVVVGIVVSVVCLVRGLARYLAGFALLVGLAMVVLVVVVWVQANA